MKRMISGIQPTGIPTLGNYLGAIKNFVTFSQNYDSYIFIADLHSVTQNIEPETLRKNTLSLAAFYIACGLNHDSCSIFVQSQNPHHSQLGWLMITQTGLGELNRMTQFKDKRAKFKEDHIPSGLLNYPSLQAADIALYNADIVPIGQDQKQHLELTKILINRVNKRYNLNLNIPEAKMPQNTKKIMSLQNPLKKMSKSDEKILGTIFLDDSLETITKKIKKAVTDNDGEVRFDVENKPGISNLINIYQILTNKSYEEIEQEFLGQNYGVFKDKLTKVIWNEIEPIQKKYYELLKNENKICSILESGLQKSLKVTTPIFEQISNGFGFLARSK